MSPHCETVLPAPAHSFQSNLEVKSREFSFYFTRKHKASCIDTKCIFFTVHAQYLTKLKYYNKTPHGEFDSLINMILFGMYATYPGRDADRDTTMLGFSLLSSICVYEVNITRR
jgi:hypothetical protein